LESPTNPLREKLTTVIFNDVEGSVELEYPFKEEGTTPEAKSYQMYLQNAALAEVKGEPVNGVRGVWALNALEYAADIVWCKDLMHSFSNVIKDSIKVLRPSIYGFQNRTESDRVRNACKESKIFRDLWTVDPVKNPRNIFDSLQALRFQFCFEIHKCLV
jgi:hypothetical protein